MHLNTAKCKVRHLGRENRGHTYRMENWALEVSDSAKNNGSYWIIGLTWAHSKLLWQRALKDILDIYTGKNQVEVNISYHLCKQHWWSSTTWNKQCLLFHHHKKILKQTNVQKRITHTHKKISLIRIKILISFAQEKLKLSSIISYRKKKEQTPAPKARQIYRYIYKS